MNLFVDDACLQYLYRTGEANNSEVLQCVILAKKPYEHRRGSVALVLYVIVLML